MDAFVVQYSVRRRVHVRDRGCRRKRRARRRRARHSHCRISPMHHVRGACNTTCGHTGPFKSRYFKQAMKVWMRDSQTSNVVVEAGAMEAIAHQICFGAIHPWMAPSRVSLMLKSDLGLVPSKRWLGVTSKGGGNLLYEYHHTWM